MSLDARPASTPARTSGTGTRRSAARSSSTSWRKGVKNLAAITGDIHTFFAGDLTRPGTSTAQPVGVELVGGSATSLGFPE